MVVVEVIELLNNSRNIVVKIIKETTQLNLGKNVENDQYTHLEGFFSRSRHFL